MDKTSTTPPVNETDLLHIPPVPPPPPPLLTEDQYGDPYELPREISESIRPLLVISGRATSSEILPILERIHPLLVAYVEEIKNRKQRDNRMGVLLRQTCYYFASQLPLRHHNMKEWSIWVPAADDYDSLGPEKAIGETELFDSTHRYKRREAQYLSYKTEWLKLNDAYKNAVEKRDKAIAAREKAERDRLAAELEAKKKLEEKERKQPAGALQFKFGSKSTHAKNNRKGGQFKVQTPESIYHQLTLKRPSQFQGCDSASKVPRLDTPNMCSTLLAPSNPEMNDVTFPGEFSSGSVLLSRALDLGPPCRAVCYSCFVAGLGTSCDHDESASGACTRCRNGHKRCESLAHHGEKGQSASILFQAARGSIVAYQVAQIEHCQALIYGLSQIIASEVDNMEVLVSNLMNSLTSIQSDGAPRDAIPVSKAMALKHPLLQRLIDAGLLKSEDLNLTGPPTHDHDSYVSSDFAESSSVSINTRLNFRGCDQMSGDEVAAVEK